MRKKILVIASVALLLSLLVGVFGCSAPAAPTAKTTAPAPAPAPAPSPSPTAAPKPTTTTPAPTAGQPAVIRWRFQNNYTSMNPPLPGLKGLGGMGQVGTEWAQWVEAMSNGRLKIDLAAPNSIVPAADVFRAVSTGALDGSAMNYAAYYEGQMPEVAIETGLWADWADQLEKYDYFYNRGAYELMEAQYEKNNVVWFPYMNGAWGGYHLLSNKPVKTLADLKGMKIRIPGIAGKVLQKLGAQPTVISSAESYMALKLGTVDGVCFGYSVLESDKLKEVVKYINPMIDSATANISVIINKNKLKALPPDLQALIMESSKYKILELALRINLYDQYLYNRIQKEVKIPVYEFTPAEKATLINTAKEFFPEVAARSPVLKQLIDILLQQHKDLNR